MGGTGFPPSLPGHKVFSLAMSSPAVDDNRSRHPLAETPHALHKPQEVHLAAGDPCGSGGGGEAM